MGANRARHRSLAGRPILEGKGSNHNAGREEMVVLIGGEAYLGTLPLVYVSVTSA